MSRQPDPNRRPSGRIDIKDVTPHADGSGKVSLYAKRQRIQVKDISGLFQQLRTFTIWSTMGVYLLLPWLQWGDRQAVLFDLPNRQFHIFGFTFWPQDFILLSWLLIILAFGLFLLTVLAGRVYCGYMCPQTTWTRFFMWIEQLFEGDRHRRLKLDQALWGVEKTLRRGSKHLLWLLLAVLTGVTFVGYFTPIPDLVLRMFQWQWGGWEVFWVAFFTVATYMNAGFLREQVCLYMCPYARFQSVMFDRDTLIVSYDAARGEPRGRGAKKKQQKTEQFGDCIDCDLCVQVCPTGIDIRDGLQYECITCAACIDACDSVMESIDKPKGLIRYTTESLLAGDKPDWFRPRLLGYGAAVVVMSVLFIVTLYNRVPLHVDVIRDRNQLFRETSTGMIENVYRLQVMNKSQQDREYRILLDAPEGLTLIGRQAIYVAAGGQYSLPVTVSYDPYVTDLSSSTIRFVVQAADQPSLERTHESRFITP